MGALDEPMAPSAGRPRRPFGRFPGADARRLRRDTLRFADRHVLTDNRTTTLPRRIDRRTVGLVMPQLRDFTRDIGDFAADTRQFGLPAAFVFDIERRDDQGLERLATKIVVARIARRRRCGLPVVDGGKRCARLLRRAMPPRCRPGWRG